MELMKLHLEAEATAESLRQRLARNPDFDLHKAFSDMDFDRNGYITYEEFSSLLDFHGIGATPHDV
jgi:Ca2+-binding EF-hand superfamily protein